MVSYTLNEKTQILETQFKGNVYLTEILDYVIGIRKNAHFPRALKILTDAQNASFRFSLRELDAIIQETEKLMNYYDTITDTIIIDTPETAALSILYQEIANIEKYHFNIFSTREAALNWLNAI